MGGAGIRAAQIVSDQGVEAVVTGIVGPKALQALRSAGIKIYDGASARETVEGAFEKFKKGGYEETAAIAHPGGMGRLRGRW